MKISSRRASGLTIEIDGGETISVDDKALPNYSPVEWVEDEVNQVSTRQASKMEKANEADLFKV